MIGKEEKGWQEEIREAKLYYTAFSEAVEAGRVSVAIPGHYGEVEEDESISNADRWEIYDAFLEAHKGDEDSKASPNPTLRRPPEDSPFRATMYTVPGDAKKTGERLMTKRFGPRPANDRRNGNGAS